VRRGREGRGRDAGLTLHAQAAGRDSGGRSIMIGALVGIGVILTLVFIFMSISRAMLDRHRLGRERSESLAQFAPQIGLSFDPARVRDKPLCKRFRLLRKGTGRIFWNTMQGVAPVGAEDRAVRMGDYRFSLKHGRQTSHCFCSYLVVDLGRSGAPKLLIRESDMTGVFASRLGRAEIDLPSTDPLAEAFRRRFVVKTKDHAFARKLLHREMIEFLMLGDRRLIEINDDRMLVLTMSYMTRDEFIETLAYAGGILDRWPASLVATHDPSRVSR